MTTNHRFVTLAVLWLIVSSTGLALADNRIALSSRAEVEQTVVNDKGQKEIKRMPAAEVLPGTEVIFVTTFENSSRQVAENAVITNPIPEHMRLQIGSVRGAGAAASFSVDGGKTYHCLDQLFIYDAAGRKFPARNRDITHIRWKFENPLPPGAKGEVSFRAVLE
ncbi:MAG: hypothetical protein HKP58_11090 [Desulfatitalea sp.]|nr:hypothetical protein [Desulfatitalea sp.]NNK00946.1 hypothetical protein [Desulfatitalea sp.]